MPARASTCTRTPTRIVFVFLLMFHAHTPMHAQNIMPDTVSCTCVHENKQCTRASLHEPFASPPPPARICIHASSLTPCTHARIACMHACKRSPQPRAARRALLATCRCTNLARLFCHTRHMLRVRAAPCGVVRAALAAMHHTTTSDSGRALPHFYVSPRVTMYHDASQRFASRRAATLFC